MWIIDESVLLLDKTDVIVKSAMKQDILAQNLVVSVMWLSLV